jgi:dTDP-4-amino-4,6-dideoxygalactose transaminase
MQAMLDAGISTRRGIMCSHREEAYGNLLLRHPLPHSERAQDRCILLPLYEQMELEEQQRVASSLRAACASR